MKLYLTFSTKLNADGQKAVYMTNRDTKEKMFVMWYDPETDNPFKTKANWAVYEILKKADYHDFTDYWNHNQHKISK